MTFAIIIELRLFCAAPFVHVPN
eukprot:SAG11_NODE_20772_length_438_cov_1.221239_1_plen_22_part_01